MTTIVFTNCDGYVLQSHVLLYSSCFFSLVHFLSCFSFILIRCWWQQQLWHCWQQPRPTAGERSRGKIVLFHCLSYIMLYFFCTEKDGSLKSRWVVGQYLPQAIIFSICTSFYGLFYLLIALFCPLGHQDEAACRAVEASVHRGWWLVHQVLCRAGERPPGLLLEGEGEKLIWIVYFCWYYAWVLSFLRIHVVNNVISWELKFSKMMLILCAFNALNDCLFFVLLWYFIGLPWERESD